LFLPVHKIN